MKKSKLLLTLTGIFIAASLIFYGCKKYDNVNETEKGYSYFKATMSKDENLQAMSAQLKQATWLMSYRTVSAQRLSLTNGPRLTHEAIKQKEAQLLEQAKGVKTEQQLLAFQAKLGFGEDGSAIVSILNKQRKFFLEFVEENPEFKSLSKDQQRELISSAIKQIRLDNKSKISLTQEQTAAACLDEYESYEHDADIALAVELGLASVGLVACIALSEGIATPICMEAYMWAVAAGEAMYWAMIAHAVGHLNECMSKVPVSRGTSL